MFITIMHGHDRITLCAHADFRAHRIILLQPCIVMTRFRDEIIRKIIGFFCTKRGGGFKIPLLGIPQLLEGGGGWGGGAKSVQKYF